MPIPNFINDEDINADTPLDTEGLTIEQQLKIIGLKQKQFSQSAKHLIEKLDQYLENHK